MSGRLIQAEVEGQHRARWRVAAWPTMACVLALAASCSADPAFESAERANTPAAWEDYLRQHPDGSNAREARERLAARIDDREWFRADEAHEQAAYEGYLRAYPQGIHSHEALLAIANLNLVVRPPKPDATAEVQLVAPPEPVLRKPSAGAIERASKPAAPSKSADASVVAPASPSSPPRVPASVGAAQSAAFRSEPQPKPVAAPTAAKPAPAAVVAARAPTSKPSPAAPAAAPVPPPVTVAAVLPPPRVERHQAPPGPAATPPAEPLAVRAEDARGYRVQLGAFFSEGSATAERVWRQLQSRYPTLQGRHPIIAAARSADGRSIYRLQVGGLEREAAEAMCASLAEQHDPCIVIAPLKGRTP